MHTRTMQTKVAGLALDSLAAALQSCRVSPPPSSTTTSSDMPLMSLGEPDGLQPNALQRSLTFPLWLNESRTNEIAGACNTGPSCPQLEWHGRERKF